jgi:hypothetical protein
MPHPTKSLGLIPSTQMKFIKGWALKLTLKVKYLLLIFAGFVKLHSFGIPTRQTLYSNNKGGHVILELLHPMI